MSKVIVIVADKYTVDYLVSKDDDIPVPIAISETFADAMDRVEELCEDFDEQIFVGIWLGENLLAIFDSNDWFTK